jgi:ribose/xylose/arabinose/galactoside ABC-type transport system permease subunit
MASASRPAASVHLAQWLRTIVPVLALAALIAVFAIAGWTTGRGRFFTLENAGLVITNSSFVTVGALGMMLIIAVGGIDLSAGAMLGLCTAVMACTLRANSANLTEPSISLALWATLLAIGTGVLCGTVNGTLISPFRLAPFIVTLGGLAVYVGLALIVSDEKTLTPPSRVLPDWLRTFVAQSGFGLWAGVVPTIPRGIALELLLAGTLAVVLRKTVFGRHVLAIGANEAAARLCGIRVTEIRVAVYAIGGALFGLAGVYMFALVKNYTPNTGVGRELDIIAAVVIGGGSLKGGRASVLGTLVGSLLMAVIRSGCTHLSVPNPYQQIIIGGIIIAAVLFDRAAGRAEAT